MAVDPTVSTGDIARLGRVGRAAVSNWRRRHDDFPAPVSGTASNPRFALSEVEAWLRNPQRKAGSLMVIGELSETQIDQLYAYLETLE